METTTDYPDRAGTCRGGDADRLHPQQSSDADAHPADADGDRERVTVSYTTVSNRKPCGYYESNGKYGALYKHDDGIRPYYRDSNGNLIGYFDINDRFRFTESNPDESRRQP